MPRPRPPRPATADTPADLATGSGAPGVGPRTLEQAMGAEVRRLRLAAGLTGKELAAAAGLSPGMLSKIENGGISASLATVQALAAALAVPVTQLFAAHEEERDCSLVRAGQGVVIERRGSKVGHRYQLLGHALGAGAAVEPYLITLHEDAVPYAGFRHAGTEFIYMLSGEVVYRHADKTYTLTPGDALMFDSSAPHGPERLISLPMTYLSIIIYQREGG
jgi:transcriptional regulator with XRE-family HTH domain